MIEAFRRWAGSHVHLGAVGVFAAGEEGELLLHERAVDRICALHLVPSEAYGTTLSYTAEAPTNAVVPDTGVVEVLQVHMRVDPGSVIWVTGMAIVERIGFSVMSLTGNAWRIQLTPIARKLAIAMFLEDNGVDPGLDVSALSDAVEVEGKRLVPLGSSRY
jgi:hypothetical protein